MRRSPKTAQMPKPELAQTLTVPAPTPPSASALGSLHPDWLVPDWPAPANVGAVFTTRAGGVSLPPFDSFNLGRFVGDAPAAVASNHARLQHAMGVPAVFNHQVHGVAVHRVLGFDAPDNAAFDASVTSQIGVACTASVADCCPVMLCDRGAHGRASTVAAAHAGWRGLLDGVLEATFDGFCQSVQYPRSFSAMNFDEGEASGEAALETPREAPREVLVWIGPCIGATAFEVGPEVFAVFTQACAADAVHFFALPPTGSGQKYLANLSGLVRARIERLRLPKGFGVRIFGNDGSAPWCTVGNPQRFFSHRRESAAARTLGAGKPGDPSGATGRMAACVWLTR